MVLFVDVDVNEIARLGRAFPWEKPGGCPHCHHPLWWHGFVLGYFAIILEAVYVRRLICPHCRSVHRLKPSGYWKRFRSSIAEIRSVIVHRFVQRRWQPWLPRSRQRQWWRRLGRMIKAVLGISFNGARDRGFEFLLTQGVVPVSSAKKHENRQTGG